MLYTVREYHKAPDGHQYSIKYHVFNFFREAMDFVNHYMGTGILDPIMED